MTDTITEARPFALDDVVTYTEGGRDYTGTVRGIYHNPNTTNEDRSLFVTGDDYPHGYDLATARLGQDRTFAPDAQDDERGHWVSVRWDNPRHAPMVSEETTRLQAEVSDLRSQVETARAVITQIGRALVDTAEVNEWCGEYDRRATALADRLPSRYGFDDTFREAAIREREYEVCVHWTETRTYSTTVTVEASSADSAVSLVTDDPSAYVDTSGDHYADETDVTWDDIHVD